MIHIIGDSHALTFQTAKDVEVHWMGAATAMNIWKKHRLIEEILKKAPQDKYWFCLGEIDCRIHIYNKAMETGVPEYLLVTNSVQTYVSYIAFLKRTYDVGIMVVPPQGLQDNYFGYPFYADRKHRQEITDTFNTWLSVTCWDNRIPLMDIWYNTVELYRPLFDSRNFEEDKCHIKKTIAKARLEKYLESR